MYLVDPRISSDPPEVLSRLTDENNMHEDLSPETCPHKMEFPFMRW